ncbi:hypothetical protein [Chitinophaga sp. sic0106]|uniref:hypothetical protein n=1 Tax=Chitinophaga sp. sic0106 TaxID=2854785 RepID=UPI001C48C36C|nr:hypothetical protein [Chitinophaga sp. sic0106]MBV7531795.1 hypothetical protein [Chitinophaga sp. sic0106]
MKLTAILIPALVLGMSASVVAQDKPKKEKKADHGQMRHDSTGVKHRPAGQMRRDSTGVKHNAPKGEFRHDTTGMKHQGPKGDMRRDSAAVKRGRPGGKGDFKQVGN